jgi:hypothetical protein
MPRSDADQELLDLQKAMSVQGTMVAGLPSGATVAADPEAMAAWQARRLAQNEAYGQYVAATPITIGNALAFTPGQPVPLEHVIRFNLLETEQVNRVATPEMARIRKVFESDEEFLAANPHVARQAKHLASRTSAGIDPLDPRGGAAELDEQRKAEAGAKKKDTGPRSEPSQSEGDPEEAVAANPEQQAAASTKSGGRSARSTKEG